MTWLGSEVGDLVLIVPSWMWRDCRSEKEVPLKMWTLSILVVTLDIVVPQYAVEQSRAAAVEVKMFRLEFPGMKNLKLLESWDGYPILLYRKAPCLISRLGPRDPGLPNWGD